MIVKWRERRDDGSTVVHEFDWSGSPTTQEGRWIKQRTGWTTRKFIEALDELDPDAVIALVCTLAARHGRKLSWDTLDIDPVSDLEIIPTKDEEDRIKEAAAQEAESRGKSLPAPSVDTAEPAASGGTTNGHLSAAVLKPSSDARCSSDSAVRPSRCSSFSTMSRPRAAVSRVCWALNQARTLVLARLEAR